MLFNSLEFLLFFVLVFALYWIIGRKRIGLQNILLLLASYLFYGWWDWRFLSLILVSSLLDFYVGQRIYYASNTSRKKKWLALSMLTNLGLLGFFKYFNFFSQTFADLMESLGFYPDLFTLSVILPVGISFYTFQTMSYSLDIYHGKIKPTKNLISFMAFVSFFPQLVAGPIERAKSLLPQFQMPRRFDYYKSVKGMEQILWGFFKKVVVADNAAVYVNEIFSSYQEQPGLLLVLGAVLFAFQIYGDFSGYSDIAIGVGKLFGFDLMKNFNFPYFSRDIAEFWRRWHISLSTWFRDYLYIPLGGSKGSTASQLRNVFIIFVVSGFWHGANWTFIAWGFLNALFFVPLFIRKVNRRNLDVVAQYKMLPNLKEVLQVLLTFSLTSLAWIFFRSETVTDAFIYIQRIFSNPFIGSSISELVRVLNPTKIIFPIAFLILMEWWQRTRDFGLDFAPIKKWVRWSFYYAILLSILFLGAFNKTEFIYFQF
jgi:alginate O-acetyltransferase complex protein AlgI